MEIDVNNLPKHIAIIMDGNRRWAKANGKPTALGHKEGAKTLERLARHAKKIGIKYLTVYAFSTENWKRTTDEINALMLLFQNYIENYSKKADTENIKVQFLGDVTKFSSNLQKGIEDCINRTQNNNGLVLSIALNYGGREEILKATREICEDVIEGKIKIEDINEEIFKSKLYTKNIPDPDLLIRTSGESRLSNFLPWQLVYSEFLFVNKKWPEFGENDLEEAIIEYQKRTRKFGAN